RLSIAAAQTLHHDFTIPGAYVVSATVANAVGSKTVAKTVTVKKVGSSCSLMVKDSNVFMYYLSANNSCSYLSPGSACSAGVVITFRANAFNYDFGCATHSFNWNFGDGTTGSGQSVTHTFNSSNSYTVTLTIANVAQSLDIPAT